MQANLKGLMLCLYHLVIKDMHIGPAKYVKSQIFKVFFPLFPYLNIRLLNHLVKGSVGWVFNVKWVSS